MTAPRPVRDAEDWRRSPDLMDIDDKLDAAFLPIERRMAELPTACACAGRLVVGTADYGQRAGAR